MIGPQSIAALNQLPLEEKQRVYQRFIPHSLMEHFDIPEDFTTPDGKSLLELRCAPGSTDVVLALRHQPDAEDPLLYAHLTDTMNGQIHVLLYVVNDPNSPRYDVDRMPDGSPTRFGTDQRNLQAEIAALQAGLAPGQVRRGLRILKDSILAFEEFAKSLGHDVYFVEPLYYHNAVIFERYGFSYQQGRRLMESIHAGFQPGAEYAKRLNGSSPFRLPAFANSIRGRSWAIHDGIIDSPFSDVTMYKRVGSSDSINTFPGAMW